MPKPIPFAVKPKKLPEDTSGFPDVPERAQDLVDEQPEEESFKEETPNVSSLKEDTPDTSPLKEEIPEQEALLTETPSNLNMENVVTIGGQQIEIKPTKLKYFRNKSTSCYGYLKTVPLNDFLMIPAIKIEADKAKEPDQLLFNFLVAVFDSSEFVRDNYDEMTADEVDRIVKIFGRINHIDEKEEAARKNREAQEAKR